MRHIIQYALLISGALLVLVPLLCAVLDYSRPAGVCLACGMVIFTTAFSWWFTDND